MTDPGERLRSSPPPTRHPPPGRTGTARSPWRRCAPRVSSTPPIRSRSRRRAASASSRSPTRRAASARRRRRSTSGCPGALRAAHAGHRPRPAGQHEHGLGVEHTVGTPSVYDALVGDSTSPRSSTRRRRARTLRCVPATIDLAGAEIELVSVVAREPAPPRDRGAHRGPPRGAAAALRPHRLPAVAGTAHPQRARRRRRGAHPDPVRVLRARGSRAAALQHRPGARTSIRRSRSARSC